MGDDATERFRTAAAEQGLEISAIERFPEDTRTARQAADALGCELGQIVKSLIFQADDEVVLVLTSGSNRVDEAVVAGFFSVEKLSRATPESARSATRFAIGGIPPCGHPQRLRAVVDEDLMGWDTIWAAAGAPDAVFELTPDDLVRTTGAPVAKVATPDRRSP